MWRRRRSSTGGNEVEVIHQLYSCNIYISSTVSTSEHERRQGSSLCTGVWARCTPRIGSCPRICLDRSPLSLRAPARPPRCRLQFLGEPPTAVRDVIGGTGGIR